MKLSLESQYAVLMGRVESAKAQHDTSSVLSATYIARKPGGEMRAEVEAELSATRSELIKVSDDLYTFLRENKVRFEEPIEAVPSASPVKVGPTEQKRGKSGR